MRRLLLKLVLALFAVLVIGGAAGWFQLQRYLDSPLNIATDGLEVQLEKGGSLGSLAYSLSRQGIMEHPRWLTLYSRVTGRGQAIHAGDYWLAQGLTPRQLLTKLESGDVHYSQVTLVEGWTVRQAVEHLKTQERLTHTLDDVSVSAQQLGVDWKQSLEGMLFPDTYRFLRGETDTALLRRAFQRMQDVLAQEWETREKNLPYRDAYDALIMASLVEKETGYAPERPMIAGVFVRRLQKGMRLQTDPAVIYGLGDQFDGNLRSRHLKDESNPFNTYRHRGLPPTPIALAGREAIHAALHPQEGSALYFVAKGDGSHFFSSTLEEHQRAVRKYQIEQRQKNYSSSPPPGAYIPRSANDKNASSRKG